MRFGFVEVFAVAAGLAGVPVSADVLSVAAAPYDEGGDVQKESAENATEQGASAGETPRYVIIEGAVFRVTETGRTPVPIDGNATAIFVDDGALYVALGPSGAAIFSLPAGADPVLVRRIPPLWGDIVGFETVDGAVWMRTASVSLRPMPAVSKGSVSGELSTTAPSSADGAAAATPETKEPSEKPSMRPIRVLRVAGGVAVLDAGSASGVRVGDKFSVLRTVTVKGDAARGKFTGTELAAVVEVIAVNEQTCLAEIWRGDRVTVSDKVVPPSPGHRNRLVFPRHLTGINEVSISLRPFLNVDGPVGVGAVTDLSAMYRGKGYYAGVRLDPFAFAFVEDKSAVNLTVTAEAGFDARAFSIGLGLGFNNATFKSNAFSITQSVRLGAVDGLNLTVRNGFSLRNRSMYNYNWENGEETVEKTLGFEWSGIISRLTIPVTGRTALFFSGGGSADYFFSDTGVDAWLIGNGDGGSLLLSVGAGAAGLFADKYDDLETIPDDDRDSRVHAVGPMVTLGLTYRFAFKKE